MNHVRVSVCQMLPSSVSFSSEALISLKRITTYLCLPETQQSANLNRSDCPAKGIELNIENLNASYGEAGIKHLPTNLIGAAQSVGKMSKKNVEFGDLEPAKLDQNVLTNINLNCKRGELIVIVGPVGKFR